MLEVHGLASGYGRIQVLSGIDLTVERNQIVALVGSNGAGKSTLLRALSGMNPVRDGEVRFHGQRIDGMSIEEIVDLGIAHVPEGRRLFSGLTVRENLRLGAWRHRGDDDLAGVLDLFPPLGKRLSQVAANMSGGEQQMCAIARGLMGRPELVMIDELSLGLGPLVVDEIIARLPDIAASGTAVLLVEQDVDVALAVASRAYVLEDGQIAAAGTSSELLANPKVQAAYLGVL
jgi:branched-chain amino acid transport system ATP-binding protein